MDPETGVANNFLDSLKGISSNPEVVMLLILGVFAASHSGLAYLRPWGKLHRLNTPHTRNLPVALQPFCSSRKHQMQVQAFIPCALTFSFQQYQAAYKSSVFPAEGGIANLQVRTSLVLEPTELSLR